MASTKRKPATRTSKNPRASRRRTAAAEPPLQQGLLEMAAIGAQSLLWLAMVVAIVAGLAGMAFGIWSLRPTPSYYSQRVREGSALAATFRVENASPWFPLSHLTVWCALVGVDATDFPPVEADTSRIPANLGAGEEATFTCPFRAADPEVALRSELYFHSEYDLPVLGWFRLAHNSGPLVLNPRLLPPRWTAKPAKD